MLSAAPIAVNDSYDIAQGETLTVSAPSIPTDGLIHHWTFDEGSGSTAADLAGGNDAALVNWDDGEAKWVDGVLGGALDFGGNNYAITADSIAYDQYTISFWSQLQAINWSNPRLITPKETFQNYWIVNNYDIGVNVKGIGFWQYTTSDAYAPLPPVPGEWEHYAIVFDRAGGDVAVYRDGQQVASGTATRPLPLTRWVMGHHEDLSNHNDSWNGLLDDVRIYNRLLLPEEVQDLSLSGGFGVLSNDSDSDGDALTATLVDDVEYGDLVLSPNGRFTYTPTPEFVGVDTFTYVANDGANDSDVATVTLTVEQRQETAALWVATGELNVARRGHAAVLLADGRVLVSGGVNDDGALDSAEIYDPVTGSWSVAGEMTEARVSHEMIALADGRVLAFSGRVGGVDLKTAEIYDPVANLWTSTGSLASGRFAPLTVRLNDGRVLTAGGYEEPTGFRGTSEIYDPTTGLWTSTGNYNTSANKQIGILLDDGRVLSAGGYNGGSSRHTNTEIYDPETGLWTNTDFMNERRYRFAAAKLDDGRVLAIAGGNNGTSDNITSEIYDPVTGVWTNTGNLQFARRDNLAASLPDGRVITVGNGLFPTEIYDPTTGRWSSGGNLTTARSTFTLTSLQDGRVLAVGGISGGLTLQTTELFAPDRVVDLGEGSAAPGDVAVVPISIDDAEGLSSVELTIQYDTSLLDVASDDVHLGDLISGWTLTTNVDDAAGTIHVAISTTDPLGPGGGELLEIRFHVDAQAEVDQTAAVDLVEVTLDGGRLAADALDALVHIVPATLRVETVELMTDGVVLNFNRRFDAATLNLYDANDEFGTASDLMLVGETVGEVQGSLLLDDSALSVRFVKSDGPLEPDDYLLTLRSGEDGFVDLDGNPLDGNADGTPGDNYTTQFSVAASSDRLLSIPDFVRGRGQPVEIGSSGGIPVRIDDAEGLTQFHFEIRFDPGLLDIFGVEIAEPLQDNWRFTLIGLDTPGVVAVSADSTVALGPGPHDLVVLAARIPNDAAVGATHLTHFADLVLNDGTLGVRGDAALHSVAFFGDVSGDGSYSGFDASMIARNAVGIDSGFVHYGSIDPRLIGDVSGDGTISSLDAAFVARKALGLDQPQIPDLPASPPPDNFTDVVNAEMLDVSEIGPLYAASREAESSPAAQPGSVHRKRVEEIYADEELPDNVQTGRTWDLNISSKAIDRNEHDRNKRDESSVDDDEIDAMIVSLALEWFKSS